MSLRKPFEIHCRRVSLDNVHQSLQHNKRPIQPIYHDYIVPAIAIILAITNNNTHKHYTLRKTATYRRHEKKSNDTRRMALELELAGRAVQHTPAASSLCTAAAVSSALTPSVGQTKQTRLAFRRIFITHTKT